MRKLIVGVIILALWGTAAYAIGNPASQFCGTMGGKTEIVKLKNGDEIGLCVLSNGNVMEEWTLFRLLNGEKEK